MILSASGSSGNFTPPPDGLHQAVLVDVVDLGEKETQWGLKHKVRLVWELDPSSAGTLEGGRRFTVSKQYTASIHEKAELRKDLKGMKGRDLNADEMKKFDLEKLLGTPCTVFVEQAESQDGRVFANVKIVSKPGKSPIGPSGDYTRVQDRDSKPGPMPGRPAPRYAPTPTITRVPNAPTVKTEPGDDEEIPF
jgi:hypothetical protein